MGGFFYSPLMKGIGIMKELLKLNDVYVGNKGKYVVREMNVTVKQGMLSD